MMHESGPYRQPIYNPHQFSNQQYHQVSSHLREYDSLAYAIEKEIGTNCQPCFDYRAPEHGPPGPPNNHPSYPRKAPFENRMDWNDMFNSPFVDDGKPTQPKTPPRMPPAPTSRVAQDPQPPSSSSPSAGKITLPVPEPIQLGCNITSSGDDQLFHRGVYQSRFFNEKDAPIMVGPPKGWDHKAVGSYSDELFKTPLDRTENKISTGVMTNPYTGELFETFENAMPPPNTDKEIPRERFAVVNPKLVSMQGGINPHAPLPKKKEVCQKIPGPEHGQNPWGDALYADQRRSRQLEYANRDIWGNRNGDYACEPSLISERPAGFVGLVPYIRPKPYMPPTQRATIDNKGYVGVSKFGGEYGPEGEVIKGEVFVRKPDLTNCPWTYAPGPMGDVEQQHVIPITILRDTTKPQMEHQFPASGVVSIPMETGGARHSVIDTTVKSTLKEQMQEQFPTSGLVTITGESGGAGHVLIDPILKPTLKEQMSEQFPVSGFTGPDQAYVVLDTQVKPSLKEQMSEQFPVSGFTGPDQAYVVTDTNVKPTLKEQMSLQFPVSNLSPNQPHTGHVVIDTQVKSTLKEQMQQQFPVSGLSPNQPENGHVVISTTVKPTLKEQMSEQFPVSGLKGIDQGHVVIDTTARSTLKEQMSVQFPVSGLQDAGVDGGTGAYIDFQGPLIETRRQFHEILTNQGTHAAFGDYGEHGNYVGNGLVTSKQHRGTMATDRVEFSKVHQDAGDTSVTWIGDHTRDTRTELSEHTPASEMTQFKLTEPRWRPEVRPSCNLDMNEVDNVFVSMHNLNYPSQSATQG